MFSMSNRLLQISSFNGKMNALNEVNKVITSVSYYTHRQMEEEEWLTADKMAVSMLFTSVFLICCHVVNSHDKLPPPDKKTFHSDCNDIYQEKNSCRLIKFSEISLGDIFYCFSCEK